MLRNLREIYVSQGEREHELAVLHRLVLLLPGHAELRRERGLLLAELGQTAQALDDLEWFMRQAEDEATRNSVAARVQQLRAQDGQAQ